LAFWVAVVLSAEPSDAVTLPFDDDFENIAVGNYPDENGWRMMTSGKTAYVSNVQAASGSRSFRLEGYANWSRCDYIQLNRADIEEGVTYEVSVYLLDAPQEGAFIGFAQLHGNMLPWYNSFTFSHNAMMHFRGEGPSVALGNWEPERWYRIRVEIDYTQLQADVYLDGALVGENIPTKPIEFDDGFGHNVLDKFSLITPNWSPWTSATDVVYFDDVRITARPTTVEAAIDINPDTLNLRSKGKWITCYIEWPEEYDVADIDVGSILLEGLLEVQHSDVQDDVLMVEFDRQDVIAYIELVLGIEPPADVTLMVTGELNDGTPFEGSDTIRVIDEGEKK
jgi:hypothetical protein